MSNSFVKPSIKPALGQHRIRRKSNVRLLFDHEGRDLLPSDEQSRGLSLLWQKGEACGRADGHERGGTIELAHRTGRLLVRATVSVRG